MIMVDRTLSYRSPSAQSSPFFHSSIVIYVSPRYISTPHAGANHSWCRKENESEKRSPGIDRSRISCRALLRNAERQGSALHLERHVLRGSNGIHIIVSVS